MAERAIQQLMGIARSQLVKAGRGEDYCFFACSGSGIPDCRNAPRISWGRDPIREAYREAF